MGNLRRSWVFRTFLPAVTLAILCFGSLAQVAYCVTISSPRPQAVLSGTVQVKAQTEPEEQFSYAILIIDAEGRSMTNEQPIRFELDTTRYANGNHLLRVDLADAVGTLSTSRMIPVVIRNGGKGVPLKFTGYLAKPNQPVATTAPIPAVPASPVTQTAPSQPTTVNAATPAAQPAVPSQPATAKVSAPPVTPAAPTAVTPATPAATTQPSFTAATPPTTQPKLSAPATKPAVMQQPVAAPPAQHPVLTKHAPATKPALVTEQQITASPTPVQPKLAAVALPAAKPRAEAVPTAATTATMPTITPKQQAAIAVGTPKSAKTPVAAKAVPTDNRILEVKITPATPPATKHVLIVPVLVSTPVASTPAPVPVTRRAVRGSELTVVLDGKPLLCSTAPFVHQGRTMVMLRALVENTGGSLEWEREIKQATATIDAHDYTFTIGKDIALVDGKPTAIGHAVLLVANRTMVPATVWRDLMGGNLEFNPAFGSVNLRSRATQPGATQARSAQ